MLHDAIRRFLFVTLFITAVQFIHAQKSDSLVWRISTKDGNEFYGIILDESDTQLKIKTKEFGELTIRINDIVSRKLVVSVPNTRGQYWPENPLSSRYFWMPSGYGLRKGEGYFQNIWILFNQASYGFTDQFSLGLGTFPLFLVGSVSLTPFWLTPKFSIPIKDNKLNAGFGLLYLFVPAISNHVGIAYGNLTLGSRDKNVTIGLGYGFADGSFSKYPTINISGILRTGKRSFLITENYFISAGDQTILLWIFGGRWNGNGIAIDYGAFRPFYSSSESGFIAFPWLGIHLPFGHADH